MIEQERNRWIRQRNTEVRVWCAGLAKTELDPLLRSGEKVIADPKSYNKMDRGEKAIIAQFPGVIAALEKAGICDENVRWFYGLEREAQKK